MSHINLSVLIHLVCLVTEPNGFISSDNLFYIVCSFTLVIQFEIHVQMDNCYIGMLDYSFLLPWQQWVYYPGNKGLFITLVTKGFPSNKRFLLLGNNGFPLVTIITFIHSDNWFLSICLDTASMVCVVGNSKFPLVCLFVSLNLYIYIASQMVTMDNSISCLW